MVRDNHFEVPWDDVAAWEPALAVMLQELQLSEVLRHPGLIEVFEAAGLGLTPDGEYRLVFASEPPAAGTPATSGLRDRQDGRHRGAAAGRNRCRLRPAGRSVPACWAGSTASTMEYDDG